MLLLLLLLLLLINKDEEYKGSVKYLSPIIARCMKQNNTIDIYQE